MLPHTADGRLSAIGRIAFVRWSARPDGEEVRVISEGLLQMRREIGKPLLVVARYAEGTAMLAASGHTEFLRYAPRVARACESQYAVLSGTGLTRKILRATLTAIATLMGIPAEILDDMETAIVHACTRAGLDAAPVIAEARALGVFEAEAGTRGDKVAP